MSVQSTEKHQDSAKGTAKTYVTGFLLSLALTLVAYIPVSRHVSSHHATFSDTFLLIWVGALAIIQLFVQLIFFLHLGHESKPRWNLTVASFAALIVLILVLGSIWIMNNLDYHHPHVIPPSQTNTYIIHDEGIHN